MPEGLRLRLTEDRARQILSQFQGLRILVLGDLMLDAYLEGSVERISPEAPVPVLEKKSISYRLGGSANVALNLAVLGAHPFLAGQIGQDASAEIFRQACAESGIDTDPVFSDASRPTAVKTRVIAGRQQLLRIDEEKRGPLRPESLDDLFARVGRLWPDLQACIVSDYGKGVLQAGAWDRLTKLRQSRPIPLVVDPKKVNYGLYRGATAMTHNHHEAAEDSGRPCITDTEVAEAGRVLTQKYAMQNTLITRGPQGMAWFSPEGMTLLPTFARQVFDVSGAGDTVIAVFTAALSLGASGIEAALLANHAAGVVVSKFGTATATAEEILEDIRLHADAY